MEYPRCVAERITYRNEQNGYSVLKCRAKGFQCARKRQVIVPNT